MEMASALAVTIFLCSGMKLQGSHEAKPLLVSLGVVEKNVILNSCDQFLLIGKFSQIVHLGFQDSPESLHRPVVNASSNSGHALYHFCSIQLCSEYLTCVLESTVTMEQRMCVGMVLNRFIKGVEYQFVIVAGTNFIRHNPSVIQIENCTQVQLGICKALHNLEIGYPLSFILYLISSAYFPQASFS